MDLNKNLGVDPDSIWVRPTSPGIIYKDLFIIGGEVSEVYGAAPGHIRAYDTRSGELVWTFHTIPHPGEDGYETWPPEAYKYVGGANNWGGMCLDEERGMVYAPLGSPTYDFYGSDRHGENLFGNSIVALDAATGERIWHFQTIHHDIWDYDLPAPPTLITLRQAGKDIDAVALPSKVGFLYVFDRVTGQPLFPIEERPVPTSRIPGEQSWPTQPFPLKPDPYARQYLTIRDLANRSPELHQEAIEKFQSLHYEGLFTPPDQQGTLLFPGTRGGSEWGGAAVDPYTGWLFINANESPEVATVRQSVSDRPAGQSDAAFGASLYSIHCSGCHGVKLEGGLADIPALNEVTTRLTPPELFTRIKEGNGRMPSFAHLPNEAIKALIVFLENGNIDEQVKRHETLSSTTNDFRNTTAYSFFNLSDGLQAIKPPWGTLHAIDLNSGEFKWSIPLGAHEGARQAGDTATGTYNYGGPIVTAGGLLIIAATKDEKMRIFNKTTGELIWEYTLPGPGYASPSTYMHDGRQYLVISVTQGKEQPEGSIIAFALP
ncbi:MAG: PQQ-binding-like beta-propeller repeat protein [Saprospiraceae bacterium]|nr:PQQ-binding-like beta-propeller repeat protein [Saprospiraceae bacterium]